MNTLTMYDSEDVTTLPKGGDIYAGYATGHVITVSELLTTFPGKPILTIDVTGSGQAQCLDVESEDATPEDIGPWLSKWALTGPVFDAPVIYMSVSTAKENFPSAHPTGCLLWTAHYTNSPHICGPATCGYIPYQADMTQWKSTEDYDTSLVNALHYKFGKGTVDNQNQIGILYSLTTNGLVKVQSTDGGKTWTPVAALKPVIEALK